MRVGVFGGTFDPVHLGHLIMAEEANARLKLHKVLFVPAGNPRLRTEQPMSGPQDRLRMVELAIEGNRAFEVSNIEVSRSGPSYTSETLDELSAGAFRDAELYLLVGIDALADLHRWHEPQRLFRLSTVVGLARPGYERLDPGLIEAVAEGTADKIVTIDRPLIGISSTDVRRRLAAGRPIKYLVPGPVEAYIAEHGLYRGEGVHIGSEDSGQA